MIQSHLISKELSHILDNTAQPCYNIHLERDSQARPMDEASVTSFVHHTHSH